MADPELRVVIFDDADTDIYRERAAEVAREVGKVPEVFEDVRLAWDGLQNPDVVALITGLGTRGQSGFEYQFPARPLLLEADRRDIPVALLSGRPDAHKHIDAEAMGVVVPKQPYEQIAPALHEWFGRLSAEAA